MKRSFIQFSWQKRIIVIAIVILTGSYVLHGQSSGFVDIGLGGGLSYGGFGARLTYRPVEEIGLTGSIGYNLDALGYNVGVQAHLPSQKKLGVYITGLYGYNAVLIVDATAMKSKTTFFGFSPGMGVEFKLKEKSFLSSEVLVPFRPQAFKDAVDDLESAGYTIKNPLPVALCIGYHLKF